jgi:beta-glucosidase-like glycosyl hydrolase
MTVFHSWLVEMNTGVASECLGPEQCATTFVGPTGLGAAFNREMWAAKGDVLSTEMRAFSNAQWYRGTGAGYPGHPANKPAHIGTSAFGPNLNALRDPRYGRNSELPGEDPFMTGSYGVAFVSALQTPDANGHPRVNAYLKHFDAYATETNRMHSDNNVTAFDFWDSYLPQYQMVFTQAKAAGAMCSVSFELRVTLLLLLLLAASIAVLTSVLLYFLRSTKPRTGCRAAQTPGC